MLSDIIKLLEMYGWAALLLMSAGLLLLRYLSGRVDIWNERDKDRIDIKESALQDELATHQLFTNIRYALSSEIPTMNFDGNQHPVRVKLFRKILELRITAFEDAMVSIINTDMVDMTPTQWAACISSELQNGQTAFEVEAEANGIPRIITSKYAVWSNKTTDILYSYINDLAISTVYVTNIARTNTLLYLMNLKLITTVGDAERTLISLNGEISGLEFNNEIIE